MHVCACVCVRMHVCVHEYVCVSVCVGGEAVAVSPFSYNTVAVLPTHSLHPYLHSHFSFSFHAFIHLREFSKSFTERSFLKAESAHSRNPCFRTQVDASRSQCSLVQDVTKTMVDRFFFFFLNDQERDICRNVFIMHSLPFGTV